MGVPKFFRYISERFPCLSELIREHQIAEFDNLYLDMNGIIHNCSHPDDGNVHFRITEEQIFLDIFHYIETLFGIIKPQKLFFLAIDGVAPRAKMNQQRGRRFRSAKEAEDMEKKALDKGVVLPDTKRFDSNCITPGTAFMARLHEALKTFIRNKVTSNRAWQKCRVILSGHETPGEGEHKIMEYIRYMKSNSDYNPNTRHCLYGLDADLIMLGLCTHEVNISLLREEVKFGSKSKKNASVDNVRFFLLHLGLFREYLDLEFLPIKEKISFGYNTENIVDDFILMSFMVGNDFIPHLPNLHIHANALPTLFKAYMDVLPTLDGYLNENGQLNLKRYEVFINNLAEIDRKLFEEVYADLKYMDSKRNGETFDVDLEEMNNDIDLDLLELIKCSEQSIGATDELDEETIFESEFYSFKRDYYIKKLGYPEMTEDVLAEQTECYITAIQWTLYYYYRGIKSWKWFYPHHYAPFISDIKNFAKFKITFEMGTPFLPFQQLLAVLPPACKDLLPNAYHGLMTDAMSPVIEYYPREFLTDLNGKKQEWEAVVLIPFIDEEKLLIAMKECEHLLNEDERNRNVHGPMFQYEFVPPKLNISHDTQTDFGHCSELAVWRHEVDIPDEKNVLGRMKNALEHVYFPGFPTMQHISYTGSTQTVGVRVFDSSSRNPSMVVKVTPHSETDIQKLVTLLLDKEVYVDWPHLSEAKVVALSNENVYISSTGETKNDTKFDIQVKHIVSHYTTRMAIDLGPIDVLVHACHRVNHNYMPIANGMLELTKQWSNRPVAYPIQLVVQNLKVDGSKLQKIIKPEDIFSKGSPIFMISTIYYGCQGIVLDPSLLKVNGRIQVLLTVNEEPNLSLPSKIHFETKKDFQNSYASATAAGISTTVFSRITGTVFLIHGGKRSPLPDDPPRSNIGLQLKFPKKNEEIQGYTKKIGAQYFYTKKAIQIVKQYYEKYPKVFQLLQTGGMGEIFESELFPKEPNGLENLMKWLKDLQHFKLERRTCGTDAVDEEVLEVIVKTVDELKNRPHKSSKLQVKPFLLYKPNLTNRQTAPDPTAEYRLFDRVVCVNDMFAVPLGLKGTVIGIQPIYDPNPLRQSMIRENDKMYDILFDKPFSEGIAIPGVQEKRVYKVSKSNLINISYGESKFSKKFPDESRKISTEDGNKQTTSNTNHLNTNENSGKSENYVKNDQVWNMLKRKETQSSTDPKPPFAAMFGNIVEPFKCKENTEQKSRPIQKCTKIDLSSRQKASPQAIDNVLINAIKKHDEQNESISASAATQKSSTNSTAYSENLLNALLPKFEQFSHEQSVSNGKTVYNTAATVSVDTPIKSRENSEDSADALRRLLRISSSDHKEVDPKPKNHQYHIQQQPFTNFTKVDVLNLPKPPPDWRNTNAYPGGGDGGGTGSVNSSGSGMYIGSRPIAPNQRIPKQIVSFLPPSVLHPHPYPQQSIVQPQPHPQQNIHSSPGYGLPTDYTLQSPVQNPQYNHLYQMHYPAYSQRPNGPQHLNNNSSYSPGKGAFIPLQATKQQYKNKSQPAAQRNLNGAFNAIQNSPTITENVLSNVDIEKKPCLGTSKKKDVRPHPKKPSRLAARFNISQKDSN